jgi:[ribosomal protein S5]-alanine N-acetyltransferase
MESSLKFPNLRTNRLILSELNSNDSVSLFNHFSDKDVVKYYDLEAFATENQAKSIIQLFQKRFNESLGIRWAIRLQASGVLVGTCGFNSWNIKMRSAVIGYDISKNYWGTGYATEAVEEIIRFAYSGGLPCGELNRIQGDTVPGNSASEAVLRKLGFKEEGLLRESGYWKGRFHDLKCFGLIRSEYNEI